MPYEDYQNTWGPPVYVSFKHRPLGFEVEAGADALNAIVSSIDPETQDPNFIQTGTQVMEINGVPCSNVDFLEVKNRLDTSELPLLVKFQQPPKDLVDTWSNERVKE
jgi:hypothetical protein